MTEREVDSNRETTNVLPLLDELRIIARNGLTYDGDPHDSYDKERYERILHLVSEWYGKTLKLPPDDVHERLTIEEFGAITPKVGATAAVFDDDSRILLIERVDNGKWAVPGGHAMSGESPTETAIRELREETGFDARIVELVDAYWIDAPDAYGPHGAVTLLYRCEITGGERRTSRESDTVRYRDIENVSVWHGKARRYALDARETWLDG
ncbi:MULTISPECIES: NUDIX hydrolase N-terminal domain-containing protein [Halococcus]|uniref:NUDIX family hydrolase n=1 Tax=Halococcus salifodinae DSM 8989 TaxID=1227456 RepID=M0N3N2_9EURY|nr:MULTISPECIES: NUDIX hydrolase N-terminal domain-containing protein [Halococcus]EMA52527.1 NUDIX family hydrolase [Halococcus salifodinae DSM 8989]